MSQLNLPTRLNAFPRMLAAMLLVFSALALSGCFHNDDDPAPAPVVDADPAGYYSGPKGTTSVGDGAGGTIPLDDLRAMINGNRLMMMSAANRLLYDATITAITGNAYTATVNIYKYTFDQNSPLERTTATISGTIVEGSSISGTLSGSGFGSGVFDLLYADTNNQAAAIPRVQKQWGGLIGNAEDGLLRFVIDAVGGITQNSSSGSIFSSCQMSGTIIPINGSSLYTVDVAFADCFFSGATGSYSGLATTRSDGAADNVLVFAAVKDDNSFSAFAEFR